MDQSPITSIINNWSALGVQLNSGTKATTIANIEEQIGMRFPDDFKAFYAEINGFRDWDWTPTMFSLWPVERILEEYDPSDKYEFVGYCDYLISSHIFGFIKNRKGVYKDYGSGKPVLIAQSFSEAIQLINIDADIIY